MKSRTPSVAGILYTDRGDFMGYGDDFMGKMAESFYT
jgi:hypothetical protein